jgi:hypothetical protein
MDTLPKLPNELPNTDEAERIAAVLIVEHVQRQLLTIPPQSVVEVLRTNLKPVWYVDFFRDRPSDAAALYRP